MRPSAASRRNRFAHPAHALRVQAVERLVEQQHRRIAEQRGGDAEPLLHAQGEPADPRPCRVGQAHLRQHLVDPARGTPLLRRQRSQVGRGAAATVHVMGVEQRADVPQAAGAVARTARRRR